MDAIQPKQMMSKIKSDHHAKELKLTVLLILTVTLALITWIPSMILYVVFALQTENENLHLLMSTLFLLLLHPIMNPLLYAFHLPRIRRRIGGLFMKTSLQEASTTQTSKGTASTSI